MQGLLWSQVVDGVNGDDDAHSSLMFSLKCYDSLTRWPCDVHVSHRAFENRNWGITCEVFCIGNTASLCVRIAFAS
jgi:hypothetical protein